MAFNHEKLIVYQRTLPFNAKAATWTGQWDNKHAISDQFMRAAGSMLENIAMASAAFSSMKHKAHESVIKLAARLDLCIAQGLLSLHEVAEWKRLLERVSVMTLSMIRSVQK